MVILKLYSIFVLVVFLSLCENYAYSFLHNIASTDNGNSLEILVPDGKTYIADNDVLGISFTYKGEVPSGFTFTLTPFHSDIVSITDKHCKTESGDEVLVIKKRDGYYSLTTVKKMNDIECTFNIRAFFVVNNPTYKLFLTSTVSAPLIVDWSAAMYQGNLEVKITPHVNMDGRFPKSFTMTSTLAITLDTKNKPIAKRYIPLALSLNVEMETFHELGLRSITGFNLLGTSFGDCKHDNERIIIFHTLMPGKRATLPFIDVIVLAEVVDTPYTQSVNKIECQSTVRHALAAEINIEIVTEGLANYLHEPDSTPINNSPIIRPEHNSITTNNNNVASDRPGNVESNKGGNTNDDTEITKDNNTGTGTGSGSGSLFRDIMKRHSGNNNTLTRKLLSRLLSKDPMISNINTGTDMSNHFSSTSVGSSVPVFKSETFNGNFLNTVLNTAVDPSTVNDISHYTGSFGRLYMKPYHSTIYPIHPNYTTVKGTVYGKGIFTDYTIQVGGQFPSCLLVQGLQNTVEEENQLLHQISNAVYNSLEGTYDRVKDQWKFISELTGEYYHTFMLYSTANIDLTQVTWANCTEGEVEDLNVYDVNYYYSPLNPSVDDLPTAKVKVYTPSLMTRDTTITVEFESLIVDSLNFAIFTPYKMSSTEDNKIQSICVAYSTTDRSLIQANPQQYVKKHISTSIDLHGDGMLQMWFFKNMYTPLIICTIYSDFSNLQANQDVDLFNGSQAQVSFNGIPVRVNSNNVDVQFSLVQNPAPMLGYTLPKVPSLQRNNSSVENKDVSASGFTTTADTTPSLTIKKAEIEKDGYYVIFKNIPVSVYPYTENSDTIVFNVYYLCECDGFFDSLRITSADSGQIDLITKGKYGQEDYSYADVVIKNHPKAVAAYNSEGKTITSVDFTFYMTKDSSSTSNTYSYKTLSGANVRLLNDDGNIIVETTFPTYFTPVASVERKHGKGDYITTRDELMSRYLNNPDEVDSATLSITVKTKTPLALLSFNILDESKKTPDLFLDFITDISFTSTISPQVDKLNYYLFGFNSEFAIIMFNEVDEYDEEVDITLSITTLINLPSIEISISDVAEVSIMNDNRIEGVSGVAYAVGLSNIITAVSDIDTSNLNFKYPQLIDNTVLEISTLNIWEQFYYNEEFPVNINNYNIFGTNISRGDVITFNNDEHNFPTYTIPTDSTIDLTMSVMNEREPGEKTSKTFSPLVYIPDMSVISDLVRVDNSDPSNPSANLDILISPDSDDLVFAFSGQTYSRYTTLTIDLRQVPLKLVSCKSMDSETTRNTDISIDPESKNTTQPKIIFYRDLLYKHFMYEELFVICEFTHLPTAELREGRYTGVLGATLESHTLGKSIVTSVTQGYKVTVSGPEPKKDNVVIDSKVTIRDTPPSGLTPDELDKIKDVYQNSKDTVNGGKDDQVYVSDTDTYPVGDGKYDTDVDITISPSDNGDLSLDEVKDINDQFMLDLQDVKDSWNVSVSPPSYDVEVGECKEKCGVGCRLCGIEKSCKVDGDCLSHYCHPTTNTCQVLPNTNTGGDGDGDGDDDGGNDGGDDDGNDGGNNGVDNLFNLNILLVCLVFISLIF